MKAFISYRRADSEGYAGRLFDSLKRQLGQANVFMDVDNIDAGRDFLNEIDGWIVKSDVVLCVIGKHWIDLAEDGLRRLDHEDDFVRREIVSALGRSIPAIPVLVAGAQMPKPSSLPLSIRDLCRINAHRMNHNTWDSDVDVLKKSVTNEIARARKRGVSKLGQNLPTMTGIEILTRWLNDDNPPNLMGRNRGLKGSLIREDVATGRWKIYRYDVAADDIAPPVNWLCVADFIKLIIPSALKEPEVLKKEQKLMTGRVIYKRFKAADNPPILMGRKGGLQGDMLRRDLKGSRWMRQPYEVSYSRITPPRNWFAVEDFVSLVENKGNSSTISADRVSAEISGH